MNNYSDYGHVNVGTGKDITIKKFAVMIKNIALFQGNIKWDKSKPDGTPRKLLEVSKLNEMGGVEKISLNRGIEGLIN